MKEIVILDALRTPMGKFHGTLSKFSAVELGTTISRELLTRNQQLIPEIQQVIFGNVLQAGNGQNVARQIALKAGLSYEVPAFTVNEVCGSGLKALQLASQALQMTPGIILCGGTENMSQAPFLKYEEAEELLPSMLQDGLRDAFSQQHMGQTAEQVATLYHVSRKKQDLFAQQSQAKAWAATTAGYYQKEMLPLAGLTQDECLRPQTTVEKLATLKTVFQEDGTVTAGNASALSDGASALLVTTREFADSQKLPYQTVIKDIVEIGVDPAVMGISPIKVIEKLLGQNQLTQEEIDLFEINEAFAATSIAVEETLQLSPEKVNVWGGSVALGHPIGATGARIVTTLSNQLNSLDKNLGIAALCVGGGLGLGVLLERVRQAPTPEKLKQQRFYQLTAKERLAQLVTEGHLTQQSAAILRAQSLDPEISQHLIENQISTTEIPLGVVRNLQVNGKTYQVPLATEEPSVVAACNYGAKMVGNVAATVTPHLVGGQIVLQEVTDPAQLASALTALKPTLIAAANQAYPSIVERGGGLRKISWRSLPQQFFSIDVLVDTQKAMGANIVNTILESLAQVLRQEISLPPLMSILSNFNDHALVTVSCRLPVGQVAKGTNQGLAIAKKIAAASLVAQVDLFRGTTHNKGILNGIEAVVLATGNDTRAMSAAVHAYASTLVYEGVTAYRGLSQWHVVGDELLGTMTLPLALGTVGGATRVLPKAQAALELLQLTDNSAQELAAVAAAVGLAQNLAALRALVSEGIQKGHMSLQARSLAMSVGASGQEIARLTQALQQEKNMNQKRAATLLAEMRQTKDD